MGLFSREKLVTYGEIDGIKIMRFRSRKNPNNGVIIETGNVMITPKHVARSQDLDRELDLTLHPHIYTDLAFRVRGNRLPKIAYTEDLIVRDTTLALSTIQEPDKIVKIPGSLSPIWAPTDLMHFVPNSSEHYHLFRPGISGSPVILDGHVAGIIIGMDKNPDSDQLVAFAFNGWLTKRLLTNIGIAFEDFSLRRG